MTTEVAEVREILAGHGRAQVCTLDAAECRRLAALLERGFKAKEEALDALCAEIDTLDVELFRLRSEVEFEAAYRENAERDRAALRMMLIRLKRFAGVATWHQEIERVLDRTADGVPPGRHTAPVPTTGGKK